MAFPKAASLPIIITLLVSLTAVLYRPLSLRVEVLGLNRPLSKIQNIHGEDFRIIPDTLYCEDLHHHLHSSLLFGASEEKPETRMKWFPPISRFEDPRTLDQGTIVVINPETKKAKRLTLTNFSGAFITHGIDIWSPENDPDSVYIFAVNHLPNPAYLLSNATGIPKARSQIELFHHTIGSSEAKYLRSIWNPQIRTPNDIYAINEHAIYFTNDHYYREGAIRTFEDAASGIARWSDIIHLDLSDLTAKDASAGITAAVAKGSIQNPNGFGHGKNSDEILVNRAAAGILEIAQPGPYPHLDFIDSIQIPNTIDNPFYFHDPYAKETGRDASGYVLAGLARAAKFPTGEDPVTVWWVSASGDRTQRLLFQDDGKTVSTASTAVLIAIDPKKNKGLKQAWLFVTGPISQGVASLKVDL
ncbi:hypothetical protein MMC28_004227 [Mycoblastus sanguinarius]|nr:hypothetical protein [Mycoblastus sanguinarius]